MPIEKGMLALCNMFYETVWRKVFSVSVFFWFPFVFCLSSIGIYNLNLMVFITNKGKLAFFFKVSKSGELLSLVQ